jgi:hypothetical protein
VSGQRLRVEVSAPPRPHLLRAAIAARLDERSFPRGPEDEVAVRVAAAVRDKLHREGEQGASRWR